MHHLQTPSKSLLITIFILISWSSIQAYASSNSMIISTNEKAPLPVVTGYGEGLFNIGELIYWDDFDHLNNWRFQVQESDHESEPEIRLREGKLDIFIPARGATIWFQHKLSGPVAIMYALPGFDAIPEQLMAML